MDDGQRECARYETEGANRLPASIAPQPQILLRCPLWLLHCQLTPQCMWAWWHMEHAAGPFLDLFLEQKQRWRLWHSCHSWCGCSPTRPAVICVYRWSGLLLAWQKVSSDMIGSSTEDQERELNLWWIADIILYTFDFWQSTTCFLSCHIHEWDVIWHGLRQAFWWHIQLAMDAFKKCITCSSACALNLKGSFLVQIQCYCPTCSQRVWSNLVNIKTFSFGSFKAWTAFFTASTMCKLHTCCQGSDTVSRNAQISVSSLAFILTKSMTHSTTAFTGQHDVLPSCNAWCDMVLPFHPFFWFLIVIDTKLILSACMDSCSSDISWSAANNFISPSQNCCVWPLVVWCIYSPTHSKK